MIDSCCFDLETSSLNADFGIILCAVIKPAKEKEFVFRGDKLNKNWKTKRSDDSAIVRAVADKLQEYDILVGHYAAGFDLPFLRTRMIYHGMQPFKDRKVVDPWKIARNKLKLSSNSLDRITDFVGCNSKSTVSGQLWNEAALDGSRKAMDYIVEHCIQDVLMLEQIVDVVKGYSTNFNAWGSGY